MLGRCESSFLTITFFVASTGYLISSGSVTKLPSATARTTSVRLILAGLLVGIVHDRKLMREAQVNLAIRWFAGYILHEVLPDYSSLTRIRLRWGDERLRRIFQRTVQACVSAGMMPGETVHIDATLMRANVSWDSIAE